MRDSSLGFLVFRGVFGVIVPPLYMRVCVARLVDWSTLCSVLLIHVFTSASQLDSLS